MSYPIQSNTKFSDEQQGRINHYLKEFMIDEAQEGGEKNEEFMERMGFLINSFITQEKVYHPLAQNLDAEQRKKIHQVKTEFIDTADDETADGWARCGEGGLNTRGQCFVADKMMETPLNPYPYYFGWDEAVAKAEEIGAGGITKTIKGYSLRVHRFATRQKCESLARRNDGMASWVREYKFSETKSYRDEMDDVIIKPFHLFKNVACHKPRADKNRYENDAYAERWGFQYAKYLGGDMSEEFKYVCPLAVEKKKSKKTKKSKKSKKEIKSAEVVVDEEEFEHLSSLGVLVEDVEERLEEYKSLEKGLGCENMEELEEKERDLEDYKSLEMGLVENEIKIKTEKPKMKLVLNKTPKKQSVAEQIKIINASKLSKEDKKLFIDGLKRVE